MVQSNYAWLEQSGMFEQLSPAGKRAVQLAVDNQLAVNSATIKRESSDNIGLDDDTDTNVRVNNPARNPANLTQSESSVAANGSSIVVSFNDAFSSRDAGASSYGVSTDSGKTFTHDAIPALNDSVNLGDGVVARGPNGEFYYATLAFVGISTAPKSIVGVAKSMDNGRTFTAPVDASTTIANNVDFQDKEWIAVDTNASSPFKGNIYVSWTRFTPRRVTIVMARSTDAGQTFLTPITVSGPLKRSDGVQGSMPVVAPNGDLYIAFYKVDTTTANISIADRSSIVVVKSSDGGKTFGKPMQAAKGFFTSLSLTGGFEGVRTNSFPSIAIDQKGAIHIVYGAMDTVSPTATGTDRSNIFYVRSTDGGNTFSSKVKLNDDNTSTSQSLPSIAITDDGTIGVRWWDRRNDPLFDSLTDVYMTLSTDGGATFSNNFQITNHNWVFGGIESGLALGYHGDYDTLTAFGNEFFISWSDERNGDPDVYFAKLPSNYNPKTPDFSVSVPNPYGAVIVGNNVDFSLQLANRNGFSDSISFSATPQLPGLNYSFTPTTTAAGQTVTLSITTTSELKPDSYIIVVTGRSGQTIRRTSVKLTALAANQRTKAGINISNTRGDTHISQDSIKVDANGTIHVCFLDDSNTKFVEKTASAGFKSSFFDRDIFYKQSTDGGKTFSTPVRLPVDAPNLSFARNRAILTVDNKGNIYVAFDSDDLNALKSNALFLTKSTDGGKTFSNPILVADPSDLKGCAIFYATMTTDPSDNILIAVATNFCPSKNFINRPAIYTIRSTDQGQTFSKPARISVKKVLPDLVSSLKISFDSQGAGYLVYTASMPLRNKPSSFAKVLNVAVARDGKNFVEQMPAYLNEDVEQAIKDNNKPIISDLGFPSISIDKNDNIYVSFGAFTPPFNFSDPTVRPTLDTYLVKSTDKGRTFSQLVSVSKDGFTSGASFSNVIVDGNGNVNVGWASLKDGFVLATSVDGGQTFTNRIPLSGIGGSLISFDSLDIMLDKQNNLLSYWISSGPGQPDVYFSTIAPLTTTTRQSKPTPRSRSRR
ncbi:MAG: sialidase family protein [Acidobacteriota bacterium]